ncbi:hypothetical protein NQD34_002603 [Periophthalmus magnuspinnatus]|nr:hypothetical protein NQD34_002603 [Periophthalmus magnuspinnatus]
MAAVNYSLSEDQFVCSICLSVFVDPVSTPCGHNFCKSCICSYWDESSHCTCPLCKEDFNTRPQLKINTLLSHMASHSLKKPPKQEESCEVPEEPTPDQQVRCDICSEPKLKAVKSCLVCLVSFCDTHLEPHGTVSALRHHRLVEPVSNLESRMCAEHHKPLKLFCKTDNICVCTYCSFSDHKSHNIVPLGEECEERKAEVMKMLSVRKKKIEQIQTSLELSQKAANKVTTEGLEVFTALEQAVQKNLDNLIKEIQGKLEKTTNQNKDLVAELENQISELDHRSTEMEKPANSEDYLQCAPRKVGVFVDYEEGVVSFHDVDAAAPIYFFTGCCFNDKLRPFFVQGA